MNSLPLISHRLFVAAAGHGEGPRPAATTAGNPHRGAAPAANVVLLELLDPTAMMLGAFEEWSCVEAEVELRPGDTLLLYSDGVTEATDDQGNEFGEERLIQGLRENQAKSADELVREIVNSVSNFSGTFRTDDVTVVAIRGI